MSTLSTHVLDTSMGQPAEGMPLTLERNEGSDNWNSLGEFTTSSDGRAQLLKDGESLAPGIYRITFDTKTYYQKTSTETFYPYATVVFEIKTTGEHYHVPLLTSGWGYSTYRGS